MINNRDKTSIEIVTEFIESISRQMVSGSDITVHHDEENPSSHFIRSTVGKTNNCYSIVFDIKHYTNSAYVDSNTKYSYILTYHYLTAYIEHVTNYYQKEKTKIDNYLKIKYGSKAFLYIDIFSGLSDFIQKEIYDQYQY